MKQSGRANVVEINGRLYDAKTGLPVTKAEAQKSTPAPKPKIAKRPSIDGFSGPAKAHKPKPKKVQVEQRAKAHHPRPVSPAVKAVHKKPEHSKTLQRDMVAKPKNISSPTHEQRRQQAVRKPTLSEVARAERAKMVQQSKAISRFTHNAVEEIKEEVEQMAAVVAAPMARPQPVQATEEEVEPPTAVPQTPPPTAPPEPPVTSEMASKQLKQQLIEKRMAEVESEVQADETDDRPQRFRRIRSFVEHKPKTASILAAVVAGVLVIGYVVYLNIPNMALRIAASRAGFEASLPGYTPSGYKFSGPIAYSPGQISIKFSSNTDQREFTITEKQTSWDSQSLLDNYVAEESPLYQTYQERGLTIYIYDGSNAAWVNGGIWYTIEGDSLLNSEQLIKMASSL